MIVDGVIIPEYLSTDEMLVRVELFYASRSC